MLDRLLADRRLSKPDMLSRAPRGADVHGVSARSTLGSGANAIVLYPLHGETSERQMMVYFPAHRLLYASDPFQRRAGGSFFLPQTVSEVVDAVAREHLAVDRVFLMHPPPTPLGDLTDELANAKQEDTPTGAL